MKGFFSGPPSKCLYKTLWGNDIIGQYKHDITIHPPFFPSYALTYIPLLVLPYFVFDK